MRPWSERARARLRAAAPASPGARSRCGRPSRRRRLRQRVVEPRVLGPRLADRLPMPLDGLPVAARDRARQLEAVLDRPPNQREQGLRRRAGRLHELGGDAVEGDEVARGECGPGVVEHALGVVEVERPEPERPREPEAALARLRGLGRDGGPGSVELLGPAGARERLQRMNAEAQLVRRERAQRCRSAHVGNPRARVEGTRHGRDGRIGYANQHQLGVVVEQGDAALAQAGRNRGPGSARADDLNRLERLSSLQFPSGYRAASEVYPRARRRAIPPEPGYHAPASSGSELVPLSEVGGTGMNRRSRRGVVLSVGALLAAFIAATFTQGAPSANGKERANVRVATKSSGAAAAKLHPKLQRKVESGSVDQIFVYVTVSGDSSAVQALLSDEKAAESNGAGLIVGKIGVQALPKLAGANGVVAVGPIELKQTGEPLGSRDSDLGQRVEGTTKSKALRNLYRTEVPYSAAPTPHGSNFEALKNVAALDAKTHRFADAWAAGYTGQGVTVSVLDGGTDFGHPDLLGTWQTWSGRTGATAGWNGWPKAFDPYGTLVWLVAPDYVDQGLTWYTKTTAAPCPDFATKEAKSPCAVQFATKTGPARNFNAPAGTNQHLYQFPASYTKSGNVRLGSH